MGSFYTLHQTGDTFLNHKGQTKKKKTENKNNMVKGPTNPGYDLEYSNQINNMRNCTTMTLHAIGSLYTLYQTGDTFLNHKQKKKKESMAGDILAFKNL